MTQRMIYQTEETRRHILSVAERLFLERGFFDTQMKDVAEAVGMSRNTLYRYYRDKTDLGVAILDAVLANVFEDFRTALDAARQQAFQNNREKLAAVLRAVIPFRDRATELRYIAEFDAYHSGSRIPPGFAEMQDQSPWEPIGAELVAIIEAGVRDGSIRDDFPPEFLLNTIFMAAKVIQQELIMRAPLLQRWNDQMPAALVTLLLDGLKPTGQ